MKKEFDIKSESGYNSTMIKTNTNKGNSIMKFNIKLGAMLQGNMTIGEDKRIESFKTVNHFKMDFGADQLETIYEEDGEVFYIFHTEWNGYHADFHINLNDIEVII